MKLNYLIIPALVFGVSALGSWFTSIGINNGWYSGLLKPEWTPEGNIIGIAWTVIYFLVVVALLLLWNRSAHDNRWRHIMLSFTLNGILNVSWSYLFFVQHLLGAAFIVAIIMWFSVVEIMYSSWSVKRAVTLLLLPYAGWLIFAGTLNYLIYRLN